MEPKELDDSKRGRNLRTMGLLDHLEELRWRLMKTFIFYAVAVIVLIACMEYAANILYYPLSRVNNTLEEQIKLHAGGPMTVYSVFLQIGVFGGMVFTLPVALYHLARFIAPGLRENELRLVRPVCIGGVVLFTVGALFAYFILVPLTLNVSIYLSSMLHWDLIWTADKYYGLLIWMTFGIGLAFEFPLILVSAIYLEILSSEQLARSWRWMLVAFLCTAALITPTHDPFSQIALAGPLFIMYLGSIWVGRRIERKRNAARAAEAEEELDDDIDIDEPAV